LRDTRLIRDAQHYTFYRRRGPSRGALSGFIEARLSLWDALIVEAALDTGRERLYTEDLNSGQRISSLVVVNPFS
jgi:hypothetical protein